MTSENLEKLQAFAKKKLRLDRWFWAFAITTILLDILSISFKIPELSQIAMLSVAGQIIFLVKLYKLRKKIREIQNELAVESTPEISTINEENKSMYN